MSGHLGYKAGLLQVARPYIQRVNEASSRRERVRWLEVVALSAPLRLVVPMDRTPALDNDTQKWCTHDATACQLEVLTSHILRSHYIKRGNT